MNNIGFNVGSYKGEAIRFTNMLRKYNLKLSNGGYFPPNNMITLFGTSEKISHIVETITHEIIHYYTIKLLGGVDKYNQIGFHAREDVVHIQNGENTKMVRRVEDFVQRLYERDAFREHDLYFRELMR